jgi:hypothetical protein
MWPGQAASVDPAALCGHWSRVLLTTLCPYSSALTLDMLAHVHIRSLRESLCRSKRIKSLALETLLGYLCNVRGGKHPMTSWQCRAMYFRQLYTGHHLLASVHSVSISFTRLSGENVGHVACPALTRQQLCKLRWGSGPRPRSHSNVTKNTSLFQLPRDREASST